MSVNVQKSIYRMDSGIKWVIDSAKNWFSSKNIQQCGAALEKSPRTTQGTCGTSQQHQETPVPAPCIREKPLSDTQGICPQQANYQAPIPGPCIQRPAKSEQKFCEIVDQTAQAIQKEAAVKIEQANSKELNAKNNEQDPVSISQKKIDDVLKDATPWEKSSEKTIQFQKPGGIEEAMKDFESIGLSDIKDIPIGKVGELPDGRRVNVRSKSSKKQYPTLEIYDPKMDRSIKIRYITKVIIDKLKL